MARGRRGVYKAEKRRKEIKRQAKQDAKRKRRLAAASGDGGEVPEERDNAPDGNNTPPEGSDDSGPGQKEAVEDT